MTGARPSAADRAHPSPDAWWSATRIKGRPVVPVEYCKTLGTVGDIILADMSQYAFIDKGGIQSASSIHVQFVAGETAFRFVYRCNGMPEWSSALTPLNGSSNTLSPFGSTRTGFFVSRGFGIREFCAPIAQLD